MAQSVGFHRDPLAFLRAGQVEFGDVFTIRLLTARPTVVAAAAAREAVDGRRPGTASSRRSPDVSSAPSRGLLGPATTTRSDAPMAGKEKVVAGSLKNKLQTAVAGVIPDSTKAETHRKMAAPGSNE